MDNKTLTIQIEPTDLKTLLGSGYSLCIAKSTDGQPYDVVWRAFDKYFETNSFSWTRQYEFFLTDSFTDGEILSPGAVSDPIELGQRMTLDSSGIFGSLVSGKRPESLAILNQFGNVYLGFSQMSTGIDNTSATTFAYVSPDPNVPGIILLKPVDIVLVWFETNIQTGTMFSVPPMMQPPGVRFRESVEAQSFAIEVDMTGSDTATINYGGGLWSTLA